MDKIGFSIELTSSVGKSPDMVTQGTPDGIKNPFAVPEFDNNLKKEEKEISIINSQTNETQGDFSPLTKFF